jgi:hypothetical protein
MMDATKKKLAAGAVAAAALAGGGAALAAGGIGTGADEQAVIDAAAKELGVEPEALESALENALGARIDAAVAAGRLTEEQAAELKERLNDGELPLFGGRGGGPGHHGGRGLGLHGGELVDSAAAYLGLSEDELRSQLQDGKSLADVAAAEGKTVAGLKTALRAAAEEKLADAVESGKLTDAQRDEALERFDEWLDDLVTREGFGPRHDGGRRPAGFGAMPPGEPA